MGRERVERGRWSESGRGERESELVITLLYSCSGI